MASFQISLKLNRSTFFFSLSLAKEEKKVCSRVRGSKRTNVSLLFSSYCGYSTNESLMT